MAKTPETVELKISVDISLFCDVFEGDAGLTPYEIADNEKLWVKESIESALDGKVLKIVVKPVMP